MTKTLKGNVFALTAVFFSSTYTIFNKILLQDFSPPTLAAIAQTFSVIALLMIFGAMPEWKKIHKRPAKELIAIVALSLLATVISPLLFLKGLEMTQVTNAILISKLDTILLAVISAIWIKEKISKQQIIGTVVMLIGIFIIATNGSIAELTIKAGDAYILIAATTWAFSTGIFKKYLHHVTPEAVVIASNTIGALVLFFIVPYVLGIQHDLSAIADPKVFKILIAYSILTIVIAQFLRFKALDMVPATRISSFYLLSPVIAIIFAITILKESLTTPHLIGGVFVITGLIFSVLHHQKHPHHHLHERIKHHGQH